MARCGRRRSPGGRPRAAARHGAGAAPHRGGTLRGEAAPFFYDRIGPASYADSAAYELLSLAYDGLVAYRRAGGATFGTLVGDLATVAPPPSPDGRSCVFRLRLNLRYSDGSRVRPEDFRASLGHLLRHHPPLPRYYQWIMGARRW